MKKLFLVIFFIIFIINSKAESYENKIKWTFQANSSISSGAIIYNNLIFFGDSTGNLYAIEKSSGNEIWTYHGTNTILGTPSILNDHLIFAQANGTVICLNISDGSEIWRHTSSRRGSGIENIVDGTAVGNGKVFVTKSNGRLYALNEKDGSVIWTYKSKQQLRNAPAFAENFVFLGEQDGVFSVIDSENGERINGGGAGGAINTPVFNNGNIYFSSWDGSVQSIKLKGIVPLWKVNVKDPITTSPEVGDEKIFVGTARGLIFSINNKGNILWQFNTDGGNVLAKPVYSDDMVFVCGGQGTVYVLNSKTGKEIDRFQTDSGRNSSPVFDNGVFYFGNDSGKFYALN